MKQNSIDDTGSAEFALRGVSFRYPSGVQALSDVSLRLTPGSVVALLGPNGSGKSTLFHVALGLREPTAGTVAIDREDPGTSAANERIGFVPADSSDALLLSVREYLALIRTLQPGYDEDLVASLLEVLDLDDVGDRLVTELSHGMRKKLAVVAGIAHRPRYVLLDEPFNGLDPEAHAVLEHLLAEISSSGSAILVATHQTELAADFADTVTILDQGRVIADGPPQELQEQWQCRSLREVFLAAGKRTSLVNEKRTLVRQAWRKR